MAVVVVEDDGLLGPDPHVSKWLGHYGASSQDDRETQSQESLQGLNIGESLVPLRT